MSLRHGTSAVRGATRTLLGARHEASSLFPDARPSRWRPQPARAVTEKVGRNSDGRRAPVSAAPELSRLGSRREVEAELGRVDLGGRYRQSERRAVQVGRLLGDVAGAAAAVGMAEVKD